VDVVLVGAGWISQTAYYPALQALGANVQVVIDSDLATARNLASRLDARAEIEFDKVVAAPESLVIVATPNNTHVPLAKAASEQGHRVLCEKPLAITQGEADDSNDLWARSVWMSTPFALRRSTRLLISEAATLGSIQKISLRWQRRAGVPQPGSWRTRAAISGGGVLVDLGPHMLDIARRLLPSGAFNVDFAECRRGEVKAASWYGGVVGEVVDVESWVQANCTLCDTRLDLKLSWVDGVQEDMTIIEIEGSQGSVRLETLFGYAPGTRRSILVSPGQSIVLDEPRDPGKDFTRVLEAAFNPSEGALARGSDALILTRWIDAIYARDGHEWT